MRVVGDAKIQEDLVKSQFTPPEIINRLFQVVYRGRASVLCSRGEALKKIDAASRFW